MAWLKNFKTALLARSLQHVVSMRFNLIVHQYFCRDCDQLVRLSL